MDNSLRDIRIKKNYSILDISIKTRIDPSLLSRIERKERIPTYAQILRIAEALDTPQEELLKEWLSAKVAELLKPYPEIALETLKAAESRIEYLHRENAVLPLSKDIKKNLEEIDHLHQKWQSLHPLNDIQLQKMQEHFSLNYTYESNRIEGNTLSLQETFLVIKEGITISGKSMQEHLEAINHQEAVDFIFDLAQKKLDLTEHYLKQLHSLILKSISNIHAGNYRSIPVRISGSKHIPPEPYLIDKLMEEYFAFYRQEKFRMHPVLLAAEMHERLVSIHPFTDGNGRTSRLIMNLILIQHGYTIANLKGSLKARLSYYKALESVQTNNEPVHFQRLIIRAVRDSLKEHIALAGG